jgi:hypothetical protein
VTQRRDERGQVGTHDIRDDGPSEHAIHAIGGMAGRSSDDHDVIGELARVLVQLLDGGAVHRGAGLSQFGEVLVVGPALLLQQPAGVMEHVKHRSVSFVQSSWHTSKQLELHEQGDRKAGKETGCNALQGV